MDDLEMMENALLKFQSEARGKFMKGMAEHNPHNDGTRGLNRMTMLQKIDSAKEECIDSWFYLCAIEQEMLERY